MLTVCQNRRVDQYTNWPNSEETVRRADRMELDKCSRTHAVRVWTGSLVLLSAEMKKGWRCLKLPALIGCLYRTHYGY